MSDEALLRFANLRTDWRNGRLIRCLTGLPMVAAAVVAWLAWGSAHPWPGLMLAMPCIVVLASNRWLAAGCWVVYQVVASHHFYEFLAVWFDSRTVAAAVLGGAALLSSVVWWCAWTPSRHVWSVWWRVVCAWVLATLTPIALVTFGNPLIGIGYVLPGWGWVGLMTVVVGMPWVAVQVKCLQDRREHGRLFAWGWLTVLMLVLCLATNRPDASDVWRGRVAGDAVAMTTELGRFPGDVDQQLDRFERLSRSLKVLTDDANGHLDLSLVVLPESIVGWETFESQRILDQHWQPAVARGDLSVLYGSDVLGADGRVVSRAVLVNPLGERVVRYVRQPAPLAGDTKWWTYFPLGWMRPSVVNLGEGVVGRVLLCFEELMPVMHLLPEAFEATQHVVIGMANHSTDPERMSGFAQSMHTEGMARLFGRAWLRADNYASRAGNGQ